MIIHHSNEHLKREKKKEEGKWGEDRDEEKKRRRKKLLELKVPNESGEVMWSDVKWREDRNIIKYDGDTFDEEK